MRRYPNRQYEWIPVKKDLNKSPSDLLVNKSFDQFPHELLCRILCTSNMRTLQSLSRTSKDIFVRILGLLRTPEFIKFTNLCFDSGRGRPNVFYPTEKNSGPLAKQFVCYKCHERDNAIFVEGYWDCDGAKIMHAFGCYKKFCTNLNCQSFGKIVSIDKIQCVYKCDECKAYLVPYVKHNYSDTIEWVKRRGRM